MTFYQCSGSVSHRYVSVDPDPYQNVADPQHWAKVTDLWNRIKFSTDPKLEKKNRILTLDSKLIHSCKTYGAHAVQGSARQQQSKPPATFRSSRVSVADLRNRSTNPQLA
jgi:hypothetical protein